MRQNGVKHYNYRTKKNIITLGSREAEIETPTHIEMVFKMGNGGLGASFKILRFVLRDCYITLKTHILVIMIFKIPQSPPPVPTGLQHRYQQVVNSVAEEKQLVTWGFLLM